MLSSVPELHGYIDKSQLTEDLGGTLDYCHTRWLCHRTVSRPGLPARGCWLWAVGLLNPDLIGQIAFALRCCLFQSRVPSNLTSVPQE